MLVEPAYRLEPQWDYTAGDLVADVCTEAGFAPDAEQRLILDAVFGFRNDKPAAFETAVVAPRQNLKSATFEMIALGWLFVTREPEIVWSAHEFKTTKNSMEHLAGLIQASELSQELVKVTTGSADPSIILTENRRVRFVARTAAGGRGKSAPKLILDEAFALESSHMGTLMPIMSTFPDAQIVYGSSAGLSKSAILRAIRDRGRPMDRDVEPRLSYFEWCAEPGECERGADCTHLYGTPGCWLDDETKVAQANTQAGKRISWEYLRDERRAMSDPREYMRERMGRWDDPEEEQARAFDPEAWAALADRNSEILTPPVFGVDVSPARTWAAIVAAGANVTNRTHVEVTARKGQLDHRPGTTWVLPRFAQLAKKYPNSTVVLLAKSQAALFGPALEELGFTVSYVQGSDYPAACANFVDLVAAGQLVHLGDIDLSAAAEGAVLVAVGEEQVRFGRRVSAGDISPIVAATLAAYHFKTVGSGISIW